MASTTRHTNDFADHTSDFDEADIATAEAQCPVIEEAYVTDGIDVTGKHRRKYQTRARHRNTGRARTTGSAGATFLIGGAIGATLMYLLDPQKGKTRRARLQDQVTSLTNAVTERLDKRARDLRNRAQGSFKINARAPHDA